jgi:hypothetical protein
VVLAAEKMIAEAVESFENEDYKEAYGKAGQALRLFISYENKLNKDLNSFHFPPYCPKLGFKRFFYKMFCGREYPYMNMLISLSVKHVGGNF